MEPAKEPISRGGVVPPGVGAHSLDPKLVLVAVEDHVASFGKCLHFARSPFRVTVVLLLGRRRAAVAGCGRRPRLSGGAARASQSVPGSGPYVVRWTPSRSPRSAPTQHPSAQLGWSPWTC